MIPNTWIEAILAVFLLTNMMLAASSRLLHGIRIVAAQGLLLGILPLLLAYQHGLNGHLVAASAVNIPSESKKIAVKRVIKSSFPPSSASVCIYGLPKMPIILWQKWSTIAARSEREA